MPPWRIQEDSFQAGECRPKALMSVGQAALVLASWASRERMWLAERRSSILSNLRLLAGRNLARWSRLD